MTTAELISKLAEMSGALAVALLLGLSPRIISVPVVGFKYPQREIKFAFSIAGFLLIFNYLFFLFGASWLPISLTTIIGNKFTFLAVASVVAIFIIVFAVLRRGQPARSTGWQKALTRPAIQFGLALILLTLFLQGKFLSLFDGVPQNALIALLVCLVIGLAEETVFRGYIQMRLISAFGKYSGWLISSLIYVLWRLPYLSLFGWGSSLFWYQSFLLVLQSLLLGWIMIKSRHALVPGLYHAFSMWIGFL